MVKNQLPQRLILGFILIFFIGCNEEKKQHTHQQNPSDSDIKHATGFSIKKNADYTEITVTAAWPGMRNTFTYALVPKQKMASITLPENKFDAIIGTPVEQIVLTSTTHIAPLEELGELQAIVGFPNTDYISSKAARQLVDQGQIKNLGMNELINTEMVLLLNPDVIVGFSINNDNSAYDLIQRAGMPVVYNGDWAEQTPLGKAEWIKFFAPFFHKEKEANRIFSTIEKSYLDAKAKAGQATQKPTVLTGGLYKDVWYVAGGKSWLAQFLVDANADYIWADSDKEGSIGLSLEAVLDKGQQADFWFNPSAHTTYESMKQSNPHYQQFEAFMDKKVYSNAIEKGAKGGLIFYEMAPQRPDLVLKDLIHILHPDILQDYQPYFFKPLR